LAPPEKPPKAGLTDNSVVVAGTSGVVIEPLELPEPPHATKAMLIKLAQMALLLKGLAMENM
jgi:hypothetical protein